MLECAVTRILISATVERNYEVKDIILLLFVLKSVLEIRIRNGESRATHLLCASTQISRQPNNIRSLQMTASKPLKSDQKASFPDRCSESSEWTENSSPTHFNGSCPNCPWDLSKNTPRCWWCPQVVGRGAACKQLDVRFWNREDGGRGWALTSRLRLEMDQTPLIRRPSVLIGSPKEQRYYLFRGSTVYIPHVNMVISYFSDIFFSKNCC